jgi:hypothetical protein
MRKHNIGLAIGGGMACMASCCVGDNENNGGALSRWRGGGWRSARGVIIRRCSVAYSWRLAVENVAAAHQ